MGLLTNLRTLFGSLGPFFELIRGFWSVLPFAIQLVILLSFGGCLIIALIKLLL